MQQQPQQAHHKFMQRVLELAASCPAAEIPVAALITREGKIIAEASNSRETEQSVLGHAEINVIQEASRKLGSWRLEDCTLYVNLEPCPMCAGAILQSQISTLVFATHEPKTGAFGSRADLSNFRDIQIISGLMEKESTDLLKEFFAKLRT